jgi:lysozyme family protein
MAKHNFAGALSAVLVHEGGWSDHPKDPGGATMKGVTLATYRQYRPGATKQQLRNISDAELERIYRAGYWDKVRGDDLPTGVDLAIFDFAVNSGPARAAIYVQNIVGVAPDGKLGPLSITAVNAYCSNFGAAKLVNQLCSQRLAFLEQLSTWSTFGKGWSRRVAEVRKQSLAIAAAASAGGVIPKPTPIPTSDLPEPAKGPSKSPAAAMVAALIAIAGGIYAFLKNQGILP